MKKLMFIVFLCSVVFASYSMINAQTTEFAYQGRRFG